MSHDYYNGGLKTKWKKKDVMNEVVLIYQPANSNARDMMNVALLLARKRKKIIV